MKHFQFMTIMAAALLLAATQLAQASDANLSRTINGIDIYMGITHSNFNGTDLPAKQMALLHGIKGKKHHLTVALFDSDSGQRITDAKVVANIGEMGLSSNRKKLKHERFGDAVSYGRDFYLSQEGPYWIDLNIKRNGSKQVTSTRFEWKHY